MTRDSAKPGGRGPRQAQVGGAGVDDGGPGCARRAAASSAAVQRGGRRHDPSAPAGAFAFLLSTRPECTISLTPALLRLSSWHLCARISFVHSTRVHGLPHASARGTCRAPLLSISRLRGGTPCSKAMSAAKTPPNDSPQASRSFPLAWRTNFPPATSATTPGNHSPQANRSLTLAMRSDFPAATTSPTDDVSS